MSNIYIQEPPTSGKVLLKTSVGDIEIELWCREAPKACRNFIQLCMEGYYNNTIFHRVVKGFIAQGGDPEGDGTGGESIYGAPFKDEFHSRLRFNRRGLVAMANGGRDDNASQFFFTLGESPELQNKHTIFGKVVGDTIYNMIKIQDGVVDHNERPMYPQKIQKTNVLLSPFDDIVPRVLKKDTDSKQKKKPKEKGVKNFGLLSFGAEAEEDEEETHHYVQKNAGKAKSTHDVLDDPKLSKQTAKLIKIEKDDDDDAGPPEADESTLEADRESKKKAGAVRDKLKIKIKPEAEETSNKPIEKETVHASDSDSDEYTNELERERKAKRRKEADDIRDKIKSLKKEYKQDRKAKTEADETAAKKPEEKEHTNELVQQFLSEQRKYSHLKKDLPKKGADREQYTLQLLNKFKSKLETAAASGSTEKEIAKNAYGDDIVGDDWLAHKLSFEEPAAILAKDASTKGDDWYDVYDPRNTLNKRKRGEDKHRQRESEKRHRN